VGDSPTYFYTRGFNASYTTTPEHSRVHRPLGSAHTSAKVIDALDAETERQRQERHSSDDELPPKPTTNNQNDKGKGVENQHTILSTITRGYQSDRDDHETRTTRTYHKHRDRYYDHRYYDLRYHDHRYHPRHGRKFKVPKPRTYTGDNKDRDATTLDAWIQKLKDYLKLSNIQDNENKVLVMQYFLEGTAEDFYHTKRLANTTLDFDQLLTDLRAHIVPSTEINRYWDDWYKINQVRNGRVDRINTTAIHMEKVAARLGQAITNAVKNSAISRCNAPRTSVCRGTRYPGPFQSRLE
jgi:hypothetical protein